MDTCRGYEKTAVHSPEIPKNTSSRIQINVFSREGVTPSISHPDIISGFRQSKRYFHNDFNRN